MVRRSSAGDDLFITSLGAFLSSCIQIDLQVCIRQDDSSDIAPHHHYLTAFSNAPLLSTQRLAHTTISRNSGYVRFHLRQTDFPGNITPGNKDVTSASIGF